MAAINRHHDASPESASPTLPEAPIAETEGATIGRYKLLQAIGEGGFGVVYMAEQTEPVTRRVALKIIKLGMDTRQVIARFEAERQALAMMDHPNIAKVLDAGATETGRPYFVMELVKGVPITKYCDDHKLSTEDRLRLFLEVCHAIQHAHQKGIIHRDIKPSNILVTLHDGKPVPKVIDFGIAKATQTKLTDKTLFTRYEQIIGTPAYMSPEQAEMSGLDIDTRSDIYSLGVLLYELLTGTTPFDTQQLLSAGLDEMRRIIREQEPIRPSTRVSTLVAADARRLNSPSHGSGQSGSDLIKLLRRDLDWIVLKCLEKDRARRYETANGLAMDIRRHLENEPIVARPPTAAYRVQKLARKHRVAVAAASIVILFGVASLILTTAAFFRERQGRLRVVAAEAERERARKVAEAESVRADDVSALILKLLDASVPSLANRGHNDALKNLLGVADAVTTNLTNAPSAQIGIRLRIAGVYQGVLWDFAEAARQSESIIKHAALLSDKQVHFTSLGECLRLIAELWDKRDLSITERLLRIADQAMATEPPDTEVACHAWNNVAYFDFIFEKAARSEQLCRKILEVAPRDELHIYPREIAFVTLSTLLARRGNYLEADKLAAEAINDMVELNNFSDAFEVIKSFAAVVSRGNRFVQAQAQIRALLPRLRSQPAAQCIANGFLADVVARSGDLSRSLPLFQHVATNRLCPSYILFEAVNVASLLDQEKIADELITLAIARFANGATSEIARQLAVLLLLHRSSGDNFILLRELLDQAREGPSWTRAWAILAESLFDYRRSRFQSALVLNETYLTEIEAILPDSGWEGWFAQGWLLKAMILQKLDDRPGASAAFRRGLAMVGPEVRQGQTFDAEEFLHLSTGAVLRRESQALLSP